MATKMPKDSGEIVSIAAKKGKERNPGQVTPVDYLHCLEQIGYRIEFNEVKSQIEVNGEPITDGLYATIVLDARNRIGRELEFEDFEHERTVALAIDVAKAHRSYNPIKRFLNKCHDEYLEWSNSVPNDAERPINLLRQRIVFERENEAMDEHGIDWGYECLVHWMVGACARVFNGFQNWMLVLQGNQGVGKSTLCRQLGYSLGRDYFKASFIDSSNKDHSLARASHFIWEVEELDGTMDKSDMARLKAFLTQDNVKERLPYGKFEQRMPACSSFIGTVNGQEFLKDVTGNRRFLCCKVLSMELDVITSLPFELMWGEAMHLLNTRFFSSEGYVPMEPVIAAVQAKTNEEAREGSALEDIIKEMIIPDAKCAIRCTELNDKLSHGVVNPSQLQSFSRQVSQAMRALGYVKKNARFGEVLAKSYVGCRFKR